MRSGQVQNEKNYSHQTAYYHENANCADKPHMKVETSQQNKQTAQREKNGSACGKKQTLFRTHDAILPYLCLFRCFR